MANYNSGNTGAVIDAQIDKMESVTASATELNYVGGVTSAIQTQMDTKAPLASPTLTGTPIAPTAGSGTDTTQIATTAFVQSAVQGEDTLAEMNDTSLSSPDDSDFLVHNGTAWVNESGATARTSLGVDASGTINYTHPNHSGDVTSVSDGATTIANDAVTYAKMQNVSATDRILGRDTSGAGIVEEITPANVRAMINVEDGSTADQSNAEIKTAYEANADTNEFSDAEQTKLSGIEASADVTDSTNVNSAGAVMESDISGTPAGSIINDDTMASASNTTLATSESIKAYAQSLVASSVEYIGGYNASTNSPDLDTSPSGVTKGDMYTVTTAGTFFTQDLEVGDVLISEQDSPTALTHWSVVNKDLDASSIKTSYESNADTNAYTDAEVTKLSGIATSATANDTDVNLKARANHTGTQTASTISDFDTEVANNSAVTTNTAKVSNVTHTGDVTGSTSLSIASDVVGATELGVTAGTVTASKAVVVDANKQVDAMHFSGDVGIGTDSPGAKLEIMGDGAYTAKYRVAHGTAGYYWDIGYSDANLGNDLQFVNNDSGSNTENTRMVIESGGNVGIGTTAPQDLLQVGAHTSGAPTGEDASAIFLQGIGFFNSDLDTSPYQSRIAIDTGNTYIQSNEYYDGGWQILDSARAPSRITLSSADADSKIMFYTKAANSGGPTERLRIDSSGNVGIGVAPYSWSNLTALQLGRASVSSGNSDTYFTSNGYYSTTAPSGWKYGATTTATQMYMNASGGEFVFRNATSGTADTALSWSERMRIDSAGNVEIKTGYLKTNATSHLVTNGNELNIFGSLSSSTDLYINYQGSLAVTAYRFNNGLGAGTYVPLKASAFTVSSDYRLKENIKPLDGSLDRINKLRPISFNFINKNIMHYGDLKVDGFLAHEVGEVVPECVTGTKDAMMDKEVSPSIQAVEAVIGQSEIAWTDKPTSENNKDEIKAWMDTNSLSYNSGDTKSDLINKIPEFQQEFIQSVEAVEAVEAVYESVPDYQGIDQSKLVPLLVSAIQELSAKVEALESK